MNGDEHQSPSTSFGRFLTPLPPVPRHPEGIKIRGFGVEAEGVRVAACLRGQASRGIRVHCRSPVFIDVHCPGASATAEPDEDPPGTRGSPTACGLGGVPR